MTDYGSIDFDYVVNDIQSIYKNVDVTTIKHAMLKAVNKYRSEEKQIKKEQYFSLETKDDPMLGSLRGYITFSRKDIIQKIEQFNHI
jgi:hypothetical protein